MALITKLLALLIFKFITSYLSLLFHKLNDGHPSKIDIIFKIKNNQIINFIKINVTKY